MMVRRRPGDKPLSKPMVVNLLTHICITRPQWVKATARLWPDTVYVQTEPAQGVSESVNTTVAQTLLKWIITFNNLIGVSKWRLQRNVRSSIITMVCRKSCDIGKKHFVASVLGHMSVKESHFPATQLFAQQLSELVAMTKTSKLCFTDPLCWEPNGNR